MAEVIIVKNQEEAGELYGRSVADLIKAKPNAVLGLATGSSPLAAPPTRRLPRSSRRSRSTSPRCRASHWTSTSACR